ncbi:MAG: CoA transferase [Acidimicrobiia bacterium]|nr:CoA transferase [Acidimicrobiia bacterium]
MCVNEVGYGPAVADGPLAGLRVLDIGTRIAAPFCAGLLGEQGADVIKVEQPGTGDFMRGIGPFDGGYSLFWAVEGRGRRSLTLDLRRPEGQDVFRRLAATADVVVENFRPGTLERWGIGPGDCEERIVWVRISGYGQDGPYAERPGLDRTGIAAGGLLHLTGYPDRPPVRVGVTISDYLTGTFAAHAAVSALYGRDRKEGGKGVVIDAALYGATLRILEWTLAAYDRLGVVRNREGNRLANSAPLDNFATADGGCVCIVAGSDANFARLCAAMDRTDLPEDPRFATLADRAAHGDEINGIVADWAAARPAADVEAACLAHAVPVASAYTVADIFDDPHMAARGDIVTVDDPVLGPVRQQAPFPRVGRPVAPTGAPRLGEHSRAVLREVLALDDATVDRLESDGII